MHIDLESLAKVMHNPAKVEDTFVSALMLLTTAVITFLGCYLPIQAQPLLKCIQACAMLHHFQHVLIQVTNYEIYNILCLKIDLHIFKVITAASCVNIIVNKHLKQVQLN